MFSLKESVLRHSNAAMKIGTDTLILGAYAKVETAKSILDIGTGCGIIAIMLAQRSDAIIDAIEPDAASFLDACYNFSTSKWKDRLHVFPHSLQEFLAITDKKYDRIVSNPPYFQNDYIATKKGNQCAKHVNDLGLKELISSSSSILDKNGILEMIIPFQKAEEAIKIAENHQVYPENKNPHRSIIRFSLNKRLLKTDSLCIRNSDGMYTDAYYSLLKNYIPEKHIQA
jgi:tRNA1Val (adenine37-N6)-methyltransferase